MASNSIGREAGIDTIVYFFAQIEAMLAMKGSNHFYDLNTHMEQTYCRLLNMAYGWQLTNENDVRLNTPGIDLTGPHEETSKTHKQMCVQVSSDASSSKVNSTLDTFFDRKLHLEYDRLYMMFPSHASLTGTSYKDKLKGRLDFDMDTHVITHPKLVQQISTLDAQKISDIAVFLQQEIGQSPVISMIPLLSLPSPSARSGFFIDGSRNALIQKIHDQVRQREPFQPQQPIFICGPGGIGKTQLAQEYARFYSQEYEYAKGPFALQYCDSPVPGEDVMMTTILSTPFGGEICTETDPVKRQTVFDGRIEYIKNNLSDSVIVVEDFHRPGVDFDILRSEESYRKLVETNACLLFTTRHRAPKGIVVRELAEDLLIQQIIDHCPSRTLQTDALQRLLRIVGYNSMMACLIAKTLENSYLDPDELLVALESNDFSGILLPGITDERTSLELPLDKHMYALYDVDKLDEDCQKLLSIAVLLAREKVSGRLFYNALPVNLQKAFNTLSAGSWLHKESELFHVYPVVHLTYRHRLMPDIPTLRVFLQQLGEIWSPMGVRHPQHAQICAFFDSAKDYLGNAPDLLQWHSRIYCATTEGGQESI